MSVASPALHPLTPAQTVGPYFSLGLPSRREWQIPEDSYPLVLGQVLDGAGAAVNDALLEIWMPEPATHPFQRVTVDVEGRFAFAWTLPADSTEGAWVQVMARGLLAGVCTRVWRDDHLPAPGTEAWDAVPSVRRATLLARREGAVYHWDVRLSGGAVAGETVFFAPRV